MMYYDARRTEYSNTQHTIIQFTIPCHAMLCPDYTILYYIVSAVLSCMLCVLGFGAAAGQARELPEDHPEAAPQRNVMVYAIPVPQDRQYRIL